MKTEQDWFNFLEWAAYNHVRLNEVWVHRYADQRNQENWKTTKQLLSFYKSHIV